MKRINYLLPTLNRLYVKYFLEKCFSGLDGKVLNVGAGDESYEALMLKTTELTTIDIVRKHDVSIQGTVYKLPFKDQIFDAVIASEVIEHLSDARAAIDEMKRVLRVGGKLILTTPFLFKVHGDPEDYVRYTEDGIRKIVGEDCEIDIRKVGNKIAVIIDLLLTSSAKYSPVKIFRILNYIWFYLMKNCLSNEYPLAHHTIAKKLKKIY